MHHIAIMNKRLGLIDKVLSGDKTIESRWLKNKSTSFSIHKIGFGTGSAWLTVKDISAIKI